MKRSRSVLAAALMSASAALAQTNECAVEFATCAAIAARIGPGGALTSVPDAWATAWFDGFVAGAALSHLQSGWCPVTVRPSPS